MKYVLFFIALFALISCQEKITEKSFFGAEKLDELKLNDFPKFYGTGKLGNYASPFNNFYGYIDGIGYENGENGISVSVFESQKKAIECMQDRINTVSCIIEKGTTNELKQPWWYSDCFGKVIFMNQCNTIIEIKTSPDNFEDIQDLIFSIMNEIAERVDELSIITELSV